MADQDVPPSGDAIPQQDPEPTPTNEEEEGAATSGDSRSASEGGPSASTAESQEPAPDAAEDANLDGGQKEEEANAAKTSDEIDKGNESVATDSTAPEAAEKIGETQDDVSSKTAEGGGEDSPDVVAGAADEVADPQTETTEGKEDDEEAEVPTVADPASEERPVDNVNEGSEATDEEDTGLKDDFFYPEEAMPTVPVDILEYVQSFGYECFKPSNLLYADVDTVFYAAGNTVVFHNLDTSEQKLLRSRSGGSIGALARHPSGQFIAVGEVGDAPDVLIYNYPDLKVHRILRGGTLERYNALAFSAGGDKLASVGGSPDYMLTVWEWRAERTILKTKAYSADVWGVSFAAGDDGQLTTCGAGHIRFWRMADTFTGLKLQGDIGKFGKAEMCDIYGYVELPDGKVVSGSEWGNMLLWEAGKIKCEIARKGKKPCHTGRLEVVVMDEGEIITAGFDGHARVWNFDEIDLADAPSEQDLVYEMEPLLERKIGAGAKIKSICRATAPGGVTIESNDDDSTWYAQDETGAIWKADLARSDTARPPSCMADFHSGSVAAVDVSPVSHIAATIGVDGTVKLYSYTERSVLETVQCPIEDTQGTCLKWAPKTLDSSGRTFFAGYSDGVLRQFQCSYDGEITTVVLIKAWKPLSRSIRSIQCSPQGDLVVVGDERHLFFFDCAEMDLEPIGFYNSLIAEDGDFTFLRFYGGDTAGDNRKLLVGRSDATLLEFTPPKLGDFDTSKTYRINVEAYKPRVYKFKSVMKKIEAMKKSAEESKKSPKKKSKDGEKEELTEEEQAEQDREKAAAKAEAEKVYPPSPLLNAWYTDRGSVMVTAGGRDSGYLYECNFDMEEPSMWYPLEDKPGLEISSAVELVCGSKILLLGTDGALRLHETSDFQKPPQKFPVHNSADGFISAAVESFDGAYLLTAGRDGNFFVFRAAFDGATEHNVETTLEPLSPDLVSTMDITSPTAYSIEEAKQKAEADAMAMTADEKKSEVRREIRILRRDFEQLLKLNAALPDAQRLSNDQFILDPLLAEKVRSNQEAQQEQLRAEMAWTLEKYKIGHEKLRQRFIERVEDPLYVVKSIRGDKLVSTFRLVQVSKEFRRASEGIFSTLVKMSAWGTRARKRLERGTLEAQDENEDEDMDDEGITVDRERPNEDVREMSGKLLQAQEAVNARKAKRAARKEEWVQLMAKKPAPDAENPDDLVELQSAMDNIGDYKLKTAQDFKLKKMSERVTSVSKRTQIVKLRQKIYDAKGIFNAYVMKIRNAKKQAINEIKEAREMLIAVLSELGEPLVVPKVPVLSPDEEPEKIYEYNRAILDQFKIDVKAEEEAEAAAAAAARSAGGFGGLGADGDEDDEHSENDEDEQALTAAAREEVGADLSSGDAIGEDMETVDQLNSNRSWSGDVWRPKVFRSMVNGHRVKLEYERDQLRKKIESIITDFDNRVNVLLAAKRECEVRIKFAEHQHVVYYRELVHLKSFDVREDAVERRLSVKKYSQMDCADRAKAKEAEYVEKRKLVKQLEQDAKQVHVEFASALGEGHKFEKYLTKVFKKKVKRRKPGEEKEDSDSDEESSSDEDDDFDSDDEDEEFDDTVCPPGCEEELFEKVLALRERRLDAEEGSVEEKRACDMLKKETDILRKKEKALESEKAIEEKELAELQLEKQAKLNELDTAVPLRLDQIKHFTGKGAVPKNLSESLVFSVHEIENLEQRIQQLTLEKQRQKSEYKNIKQIQARLNHEKKELDKSVAEMKTKCDELQMLKFGALVDLEALESQGVNLVGQELRSELTKLEAQASRTVKAWNEKVFAAKLERTNAIKANTDSIKNVTGLASEQNTLAAALTEAQDEVKSEATLLGRIDKMELIRLQERANMQAVEIEQMQWEISMLSQKSGSVNLPATRPMQSQTQAQKESRVETLPPIK